MPIAINYDVPFPVAGNIAYQGGRGMFLQERDKYQQQDRKIAQQESQFQRDLQYRQQLAMLKNRQFEDELGQNAYQFEQRNQSKAYESEMNRRNQLMGLAIGEQYRVAGEGRADERQKALEERANKRILSKEVRGRVQQEQDRQFEMNYRDAQAIQKQFPRMNDEQRQQVIGQYEERTGMDFPFTDSFSMNRDQAEIGQAKSDLIAALGGPAQKGENGLYDGGWYMEGDEGLFIDPQSGEHYFDPPTEREKLIDLREERRKDRDRTEEKYHDRISRENIATASAKEAVRIKQEKDAEAEIKRVYTERKKLIDDLAKEWKDKYKELLSAPDESKAEDGKAPRLYTDEEAKQKATEYMNKLAENMPHLGGQEMFGNGSGSQASPIRVTTPSDMDKVKSGMYYIAPDGLTYLRE